MPSKLEYQRDILKKTLQNDFFEKYMYKIAIMILKNKEKKQIQWNKIQNLGNIHPVIYTNMLYMIKDGILFSGKNGLVKRWCCEN